MRRSKAPSQQNVPPVPTKRKARICKDEEGTDDEDEDDEDYKPDTRPTKKKTSLPTYNTSQFLSPYRKPLTSVSPANGGHLTTSNEEIAAPSGHELLIKSILSKPFKVPMKNYGGGGLHGRSLGMRKSASKLCLYDPFEEGALVLYHPPEGKTFCRVKIMFIIASTIRIREIFIYETEKCSLRE